MTRRYNYPDDFPEEMLDKAIDLYELGINELAWKRENIFDVLSYLCSNDFVILGGDVYAIHNGQLKSTGDNWDCHYDSSMNWSQIIEKGRATTLSYIEKYYLRNGDQYCYSLVFRNRLQHYMRG